MTALAKQRCFNHSLREAAAKCPECSRFFCRECITEHKDRVLCSACLKKTQKEKAGKSFGLSSLIKLFNFLAGVFLLWIFFYYMGQILIKIPSSFHEGTIWKTGW